MKLIITRPQHDITTRYLSSWAGEIIDFAKKKGIEVCDLVREKANKVEFEGRVKKIKPDVIFLNGHGSDDCVTGHDNSAIVSVKENHNILNNKITYALSCNSGNKLGPKVVENGGGTVYIGYSDEFIFMADNNYLHKPIDDPKARPFLEASNQVMISLLKGHSAKDSSERSKNKFKDYTKLLSSDTDSDLLQAAQFLWWNMRNQVCLGDIDAKL